MWTEWHKAGKYSIENKYWTALVLGSLRGDEWPSPVFSRVLFGYLWSDGIASKRGLFLWQYYTMNKNPTLYKKQEGMWYRGRERELAINDMSSCRLSHSLTPPLTDATFLLLKWQNTTSFFENKRIFIMLSDFMLYCNSKRTMWSKLH